MLLIKYLIFFYLIDNNDVESINSESEHDKQITHFSTTISESEDNEKIPPTLQKGKKSFKKHNLSKYILLLNSTYYYYFY